MDKLVNVLEELDLIDNAVLIERCSLEDQKVWTDIREAAKHEIHYFSTMIVRK
jgi:precorrin-2/cobalt-factor-2 C20-methyltransferase